MSMRSFADSDVAKTSDPKLMVAHDSAADRVPSRVPGADTRTARRRCPVAEQQCQNDGRRVRDVAERAAACVIGIRRTLRRATTRTCVGRSAVTQLLITDDGSIAIRASNTFTILAIDVLPATGAWVAVGCEK